MVYVKSGKLDIDVFGLNRMGEYVVDDNTLSSGDAYAVV